MTWWLKDLEVDEISFVDVGASGDAAHRPAVVLLKRKGDAAPAWSVKIPVVKLDPDKRLATGWAMVAADSAGRYIEDFQGDQIAIDDLEKAAHLAMKTATAGDMHERSGLGEIVESMVVTSDKREALGFGPGPAGWAVTMKVADDALWRDAKAGKKLELSIRGRASRVPVAAKLAKSWMGDVPSTVKHLVAGGMPQDQAVAAAEQLARQNGSSKRGLVDKIVGLFRKSLEQVAKEGELVEINIGTEDEAEEEDSMDLTAIMAKLTPDEQKLLQDALAAAGKAPAAGAPAAPSAGPDMAAKALAKLTPAERAAVEKAKIDADEKAQAEAVKNADLKKRLDVLEDAIETKAFIEKAAELDHLPGMKRDELAKVLRSASKALSAEQYAALAKSLKSAAAAVKAAGLFRETGSGAEGDGTAYEKLKGIAKSLREKDTTLSEAAAMSKASDLNPSLHAEHLKEQR